MTDIFCGLLAIKGLQIALENKEITVQSYQKMSNLNTKKSPWIEGVLFTVQGI